LRIALLAYEYPPHYFGGVGIFSHTLANALESRGHQVLVLAHTPKDSPHISRVGSKTLAFFPSGSVVPRHFWWQIRNRSSLLKVLKRYEPDVIHCNSTVASLLLDQLKSLGKPIVVTVHGDYVEMARILASRGTKAVVQGWIKPHELSNCVAAAPLYETFLRCEMKNADSIVAVAKHVETTIRKRTHYKGLITTIYHGVAIDGETSHRFEGSADAVKVSFIGRLVWIKGVTLLLKALRSLRSTRLKINLEIIGDGPLRNRLRRETERYRSNSVNISFSGFVPRDHVLNSIRKSVAVLIPSYYEAISFVLLESLALGTPALVSNFEWSREFMSQGPNVISTDYHGGMLQAKLEELAEQNKHCADSNVFTAQKMVDRYLSLYESLI